MTMLKKTLPALAILIVAYVLAMATYHRKIT